MRRQTRRGGVLRPGQRLPAIFVITILLPGILLAVFAVRSLLQERSLADQQIRERLERGAEMAVRDLEKELGQWQKAVDQVAQLGPDEAARWPERVRQVIDGSAFAVVVFREDAGSRVFPPGQLLYAPTPPAKEPRPEKTLAPTFAEAESLESRHSNYAQAIVLYTRLLETAERSQRPMLLHRLGRTYRKAGRLDEALRFFRELERAGPGRVGALPADLVAKFALCSLWEETGASSNLATGALELYRELVSGRWELEKARYSFYSARARAWLERSPTAPNQLPRLRETEEHKLVLTSAVEELLERPRRVLPTEAGVNLAFWQSKPFVALILSESLIQSMCAQIFAPAFDPAIEISLLDSNRRPILGLSAIRQESVAVTRNLDEIGLPWRLLVQPRKPAALYADLDQRQKFYLAMLLVVVALLIFGSYLTSRTVKRELEIARLKSEFVSTVSHEFRSPLTGIRQLGDMLLRGRVKSEERRQEYYAMIVRESDRLARLVDNVLDFSRMEEGRKQYDFKRLQTAEWLKELVEDFRAEVAGKNKDISIVASIPENLPFIEGDREALGCAVHNLLDNAVKYSPDSKTVWLDAQTTDSRLSIRVRDQGIGIPEEDQKYIFDKFYRGSGEITRQVKGAGIGLALVRHIVAAHGGSIEFESRLGKGSAFSIHLPAELPSVEG